MYVCMYVQLFTKVHTKKGKKWAGKIPVSNKKDRK